MSQTLPMLIRQNCHRPHWQNPRNPMCETSLRRICGTCTHWQGGLRGPGSCALYTGPDMAGLSAASCDDWSRKVAPAAITEPKGTSNA
jgi:hypothetical protein